MDHFYSYLFVTTLNILDVIKQIKNLFVQSESLLLL